jgi:hypothetical protein
MDQNACNIVEFWDEQLTSLTVEDEPCLIWMHNHKLINNIKGNIYEPTHSKEIASYWLSKGEFLASETTLMHTEVIGKAIRESTISCNIFITIHASRMCDSENI